MKRSAVPQDCGSSCFISTPRGGSGSRANGCFPWSAGWRLRPEAGSAWPPRRCSSTPRWNDRAFFPEPERIPPLSGKRGTPFRTGITLRFLADVEDVTVVRFVFFVMGDLVFLHFGQQECFFTVPVLLEESRDACACMGEVVFRPAMLRKVKCASGAYPASSRLHALSPTGCRCRGNSPR